MNEAVQTEKQNLALEFCKAWLYIFLFALRGAKYVCWDFWIVSFNYVSFHLDKAYQKLTNPEAMNEVPVATEAEIEDIYQRTKIRKEKKVRQYHYSKSTMKKYMKMKEAFDKDLQNAGATRSKYPNTYRFTVRNSVDGKIFTGTMSGFSKLDINSFLVNEGYEVFDIKTSTYINFIYKDSSILGKKMSTKDLVFWLTQLSTYIKAGITLNEAVKILASQLGKDKTRQRMFRAICYELSLGESFSNALAKQGSFFPPLLINMIKAAEASGTLQETLDDMAEYYNEVNKTRKDMISALTYPSIIMVFAVAILAFIIIYVVPQFTKIYVSSGLQIKGLTALIINLSSFMQTNALALVLLIVLAMVVVWFSYKNIKAVRVPMQIFFMHVPVVKDVIIYKELTIFAKTFASLLKNNVYITDSVGILSKITNNEVYKAVLYKTINNIIKGDKISSAFRDHWAIPEVAYYMIVTGESTGRLDDMMQKVADYYQQMHKSVVASLKSFIEPIMIIFLAVMVAIILIAVIYPMFQLYDQMI